MKINIRSCFILGLVGLIQGAFYYYFDHSKLLSNDTNQILLDFIILVGLFFQLAWPAVSRVQLIISSIVLGAIFAGVLGYRSHVSFYFFEVLGFTFLLFCSIYIVNTFHQVYHLNNRFEFPYPQLFRTAWNTIFLLIISVIFVFLCWGVLYIWENLFNLIGIPIFEKLFEQQLFKYLATPFFFGFGISILKEYETIISGLRQIVIGIFSVLLPVLAIIGFAFIVGLAFNLIISIVQHQVFPLSQGQSDILVTMSLLTIIFLNAVYQDGNQELGYPKWLIKIMNIYLIILPLLPILALYIQMMDIRKTGLTLLLFQAILNTSILAMYTFSYAAISFSKSRGWLNYLPRVNIILAWVVVVIALTVNSPFFLKMFKEPVVAVKSLSHKTPQVPARMPQQHD